MRKHATRTLEGQRKPRCRRRRTALRVDAEQQFVAHCQRVSGDPKTVDLPGDKHERCYRDQDGRQFTDWGVEAAGEILSSGDGRSRANVNNRGYVSHLLFVIEVLL